jgi:hypothetical protein
MKRINIEILSRKVRRKENVYIAEIQEVDDGYYIVLTYGGPMNDPEFHQTVAIYTYQDLKMLSLIGQCMRLIWKLKTNIDV